MVFTGGRFAGACALLGLSYSMGSANTDGTIVATGTYSEMHQQLLTLGNGYMIRKYTHTGGLKGGYSLVQNDFRATNQEGVVLGDAPVSAQEIFGALVANPVAQTEHEAILGFWVRLCCARLGFIKAALVRRRKPAGQGILTNYPTPREFPPP